MVEYKQSVTKDRILQFSEKYIAFFEKDFGCSRETYDHFFDGNEFPRDCEALGFEMDCGHSFTEAYGEGWNEIEHLKAIIDKVDDINIIGAGLFSRWRYYNHWAYSDPDEKDKEWFLILLHRLKELY